MNMKDANERRIPIGINALLYAKIVGLGCQNVDDYIEALEQQIKKLQDANAVLQADLLKAQEELTFTKLGFNFPTTADNQPTDTNTQKTDNAS